MDMIGDNSIVRFRACREFTKKQLYELLQELGFQSNRMIKWNKEKLIQKTWELSADNAEEMGRDLYVPMCERGHLLKRTYGKPQPRYYPSCNLCRSQDIHTLGPLYHCFLCEYDVCSDCWDELLPMLKRCLAEKLNSE